MSALLSSRQPTLVSKGLSSRNVISRPVAFRSRAPKPFTGVKATAERVPDFLALLADDEVEEEVYDLDEEDEEDQDASEDTGSEIDFAANGFVDVDESATSPSKEVTITTLAPGAQLDLTGLGLTKEDEAGDEESVLLQALSVARDIMATRDIETLAEADLSEGSEDSAMAVLEEVLNQGALSAAALEAFGADAPEVSELEDMQGPEGVRKYDEEDGIGMSMEEKELVDNFKLPRESLGKIVPEDWDSVIIDWDDSTADDIPLPEYRLVFIWQEKNLAVAVDQVFAKGQTSPLTEYFFWPRKDAWEDLRVALEARPWITSGDRSLLLNRFTDVINMWQDESAKRTMAEARVSFPDCHFIGA